MGKNIRYNEGGREFEWDESKNEKNKQKHSVSFEYSTKAFDDPKGLDIYSEGSLEKQGEKRRLLIGLVLDAFISVVYTLRESVIRIISDRSSSRKERQLYQDQIKNN